MGSSLVWRRGAGGADHGDYSPRSCLFRGGSPTFILICVGIGAPARLLASLFAVSASWLVVRRTWLPSSPVWGEGSVLVRDSFRVLGAWVFGRRPEEFLGFRLGLLRHLLQLGLERLQRFGPVRGPAALLFRSRGLRAGAELTVLLGRLGAWWLVLRDARGARCDGGFLCIDVWLWAGRGFSGVHGSVLLGGPVGALVVQSLLVGRGRAGRDRWHLGRLVRGYERVSVGWGQLLVCVGW